MATPNDTSKPTRPRRNQRKAATTVDVAAPPPSAAPPAASTATPPLTLEEAIENERSMLLQIRAMLHVLYEVLLYADDDDTIVHAEVAQTAARLINDTCVRLDAVNIAPMIAALRNRSGTVKREGETDLGDLTPYQVREPRALYLAA